MTADKLIKSGVTHGNLGRIHYISKTKFLSYIQINSFLCQNPKYQVNIISKLKIQYKQTKVYLPVCDEANYLFYNSIIVICDMLKGTICVSVYWSR